MDHNDKETSALRIEEFTMMTAPPDDSPNDSLEIIQSYESSLSSKCTPTRQYSVPGAQHRLKCTRATTTSNWSNTSHSRTKVKSASSNGSSSPSCSPSLETTGSANSCNSSHQSPCYDSNQPGMITTDLLDISDFVITRTASPTNNHNTSQVSSFRPSSTQQYSNPSRFYQHSKTYSNNIHSCSPQQPILDGSPSWFQLKPKKIGVGFGAGGWMSKREPLLIDKDKLERLLDQVDVQQQQREVYKKQDEDGNIPSAALLCKQKHSLMALIRNRAQEQQQYNQGGLHHFFPPFTPFNITNSKKILGINTDEEIECKGGINSSNSNGKVLDSRISIHSASKNTKFIGQAIKTAHFFMKSKTSTASTNGGGGESSSVSKNCMSISGLLRIDRERKQTGYQRKSDKQTRNVQDELMALQNRIAMESIQARAFVDAIPDWKFPNREVKMHIDKNLQQEKGIVSKSNSKFLRIFSARQQNTRYIKDGKGQQEEIGEKIEQKRDDQKQLSQTMNSHEADSGVKDSNNDKRRSQNSQIDLQKAKITTTSPGQTVNNLRNISSNQQQQQYSGQQQKQNQEEEQQQQSQGLVREYAAEMWTSYEKQRCFEEDGVLSLEVLHAQQETIKQLYESMAKMNVMFDKLQETTGSKQPPRDFRSLLEMSDDRLTYDEIQQVSKEYTSHSYEDGYVMDLTKLDNLLARLKFFNGFGKSTRKELLAVGKLIKKQKGDVVFRQGELGDQMYIILYGSCNVIIKTVNPQGIEIERVVATLYDGVIKRKNEGDYF